MFERKSKKRQRILENHGKVKTSFFDFDRISLFFDHSDKSEAQQIMSDSTLNDLDIKELFMSLDRTASVVGQQYLYSVLRSIPKTQHRVNRFEKNIDFFNQNIEKKESAIIELSKLSKTESYFIQRLIFKKNHERPKWLWLVPVLSNVTIVLLFSSIFYPVALLIALPFLISNSIIHFWNKSNILSYSNAIPQLIILQRVAAALIGSSSNENTPDVARSSTASLKNVVKRAFFFQWESKAKGDMGLVADYLLDLIKGALLVEPFMFFKLIKKIEDHQAEILDVFLYVAEIDVALSIASWRKSLPHFCFPHYISDNTDLEIKGLFHPLVNDPTSNDLPIANKKSILLTGSNMSGKTTFIRAIGLSVLLSQTINTACASTFSITPFKIYSAIRIEDSLLDHTSYYYAEVKAIKHMISESQISRFNLLLFDELFKGTNTWERIASAKAILEHLHSKDNVVVCSTHDLELTQYLTDKFDYFHFSENMENEELTFDYKLRAGILSNTNAIKILEVNGFPREITDDAKRILNEMNKTDHNDL